MSLQTRVSACLDAWHLTYEGIGRTDILVCSVIVRQECLTYHLMKVGLEVYSFLETFILLHCQILQDFSIYFEKPS